MALLISERRYLFHKGPKGKHWMEPLLVCSSSIGILAEAIRRAVPLIRPSQEPICIGLVSPAARRTGQCGSSATIAQQRSQQCGSQMRAPEPICIGLVLPAVRITEQCGRSATIAQQRSQQCWSNMQIFESRNTGSRHRSALIGS